jgi:hypothetical protein
MARPRNAPSREFPAPASAPHPAADRIAALIAENRYPPRMHRSRAAEVVSQHFFDISPRTIERWDVPVRIINGRAYMETRALLEEAQRRVDAAPPVAA